MFIRPLILFLLLITAGITNKVMAQITAFPYSEDFTAIPSNWSVITTGGTAWEIGVPTANGTIGAYTPANCAGTDLDSGYRASSNSALETPRFDISGLSNPLLTFYQFRYMSTGLDGMHVEYSTDDITWLRLGTIGSPAGINWYNGTSIFATGLPGFTGNTNSWVRSGYSLTGLTTGLIRFRFVFRSNINFGSAQPGIFIDNFEIEDYTIQIADIWASTNPGFTAPFSSTVKTPLHLRISNYSSTTTIDSADVGYLLNGVLQSIQHIGINLAPNTTDTVFVDSIQLPPGSFLIKSFINYAGDPNQNNDTVLYSGTAGATYTTPFSDDFDNGNTGWYEQSFTTTHWELGYPNYGATTGAYSGTNAWDINLDTGYFSSAHAELFSPVFDLNVPGIHEVKFWQNCQTEPAWDGMRIDASTDGGNTWQILGFWNDPLGTNWYTSNALNASGYPGWEGQTAGWAQSAYRLNNFVGTTQFCLKFVFDSDPAVNRDGISIDNFEIGPISDTDAVFVSLNNNLLLPVAGQNTGNIDIRFYNDGGKPIQSFIASYTVNGVLQQSQVFNLTVNPGDSLTVSLPGFVSPAGNLIICGKIDVVSDIDTSNNSGCLSTYGAVIYNLPYTDNFESGAPGWTSNSYSPGSAWELGMPAYGATSTTHSGVNCWDINLNTPYGTEALAYLNSPTFNISNIGPFKLSCWMNIASESNWDGTRLEASVDGGISWFIVGSLADPYASNWYNDISMGSSSLPGWCGSSSGWIKATYRFHSLTAYNTIQFRFVFTSDISIITDGFSIDDFSLTEIPDIDAEMAEVIPASYYPPDNTTCGNFTMKLTNAGSQPIAGIIYGYTVNGTTYQTNVYTGTLNPLDTAIVTLTGFTPSTGISNVCGFVQLTNDANSSNDTNCIELLGKPVYIPYYQDGFDGINSGWNVSTSGTTATIWQLGTPNYGQTNSAYSAPNCWDINLTSAYTENANTALISPWFDLSSSINPILTFMQNRNTELYNGGFYIQWTTPASLTWTTLGTYNDPIATNWYNQTTSFPFPGPFWHGASNGWEKSKYPLTGILPTNLPVQFRIVFMSSSTNLVQDGVSIDDFKVEIPLDNDAELKSIVSPGPTAIENSATAVEVLFRNNGTIPLTGLTLKYSLNGGPEVTGSWSGFLPYDSTTIATLPSILPVAGPNTLRVFVSWPGDLNHMNDTLDFNFVAIATSGLPYFNDFESGQGFWISTSTSATRWDFGTPNFGTTNSAYSGDSCWDINLNSPYGNLANAILTSPIFDLNQYNIITLSFWHNYATEQNADGMFVEYTTNGTTWQALGTIGDPNGSNWFNSTLYQSNQGWSGNSAGWTNSSYIYNKPWGNNFLQVRFRFISDFNLVNFGVSLDDISLSGVVGLSETSGQKVLSVYPNPASNKIFLRGDLQHIQNISIYQSDGKLVWQDNSITLPDLSTFADGLYQLEVRYEQGERSSTKFAVRH